MGGVGIGLTISARVVKIMGGSLEIVSQPGIGTHFFFDLKLVSQRNTGNIEIE